MVVRIGFAALSMLTVLGGCHSESSIEHINAQQADALNAIAANTSESAGNGALLNGDTAENVGETFRAGATAPPHHH